MGPKAVSRIVIAALILAPVAAAAQPRNIDVRLRGYEQAVRLDSLAVWSVVNAPVGATYAAARHVFESTKIPVDVADSLRGVLFKEPFNTRREIMKKRMSWALHCGEGISGANADHWRIHMAYAVYFEPTVDGNTRLGIAIAAGANSLEGAAKPAVGCGTTGAFENEIATLIRAQVQLRTP